LLSYQHAPRPISDPTLPAITLTFLVASYAKAYYLSGDTAPIRPPGRLIRHTKRPKMASSSNLEYIITHVFLPPKLPQGDDSDPKRDLALIERFRAALKLFQARFTGRERQQLETPILMSSNMLGLRDTSGDIRSEEVERSLEAMKCTGM
jgi:hypothetical protein